MPRPGRPGSFAWAGGRLSQMHNLHLQMLVNPERQLNPLVLDSVNHLLSITCCLAYGIWRIASVLFRAQQAGRQADRLAAVMIIIIWLSFRRLMSSKCSSKAREFEVESPHRSVKVFYAQWLYVSTCKEPVSGHWLL